MSQPSVAIHRRADVPFVELSAGIQRFAWQGDGYAQVRLIMRAGASLPRHEHPEAQYTSVLSGSLRYTVWLASGDDETVELGPGDGIWIPSAVPHEATAMSDVESVESFVPQLPTVVSSAATGRAR